MGEGSPRANGAANVTMTDVARAVGVSPALVSIVMRGVPGASPATRARVRQAAAELGYVPDRRAQALRQQGPRSLGVAFQPDQEFHAGVVDGIYAAAEETGYEVVLSAVTPLRPEARAISTLLANRCGALLLIGSTLSAAELSREAARLPVVVIARQGRAKDVEFVCSDDEAGLVSAVRYLVGLGHRQIAYLSSYRSGSGPQRLHGYRKAMAEVGLGDLTDVVTAGSTEQSGALAAVGLLERPSLPTAVIAFNDRCLAGVHGMLLKRGVQVPQDVSLVGFDDSEIASQPQHRFTSVHQDIEWLGQTAAHNAISRIEGRDDLHRPQVVPTRLVVRESAGPPRRT